MYLAIFLTILVFLVFLILILLFIYPVKVASAFNSEQQPDVHVLVSWLNPFLKGFIMRHDNKTTLTVYLFNRRILRRDLSNLKAKQKNYMDYINSTRFLKIYNAKLYASYGFTDPAITGLLCGAIDFVSQYINLDEVYKNPDFITDRSYFNISGQAEINAGVSLIRFLRGNMHIQNPHVLQGNR